MQWLRYGERLHTCSYEITLLSKVTVYVLTNIFGWKVTIYALAIVF